jgi:fumarate hydratase class II
MKIANDIRWLSSGPTGGINEISLPVIQPGSSIMPGKVNPVQGEQVMMVCAKVMGNVQTITVSGQHGNLELNVMMPVMTHAMLESIQMLTGSVEAFHSKCVAGIEANGARCQELLELNPSIATALNATLGYDRAAKVAKKAAREQIPVRQAVVDMRLLDDDEVDEVLDIRSMTEPGVPGENR